MDYYKQIFKRKSFHLFKDPGTISEEELEDIRTFADNIVTLYKDIRTAVRIVPEGETTCKRGAEYCILFYSERKGEYLRNIGYMGEQMDLYLASVYRYKKPGKRGIMPADKVVYYNRIDMGILLFILETCLGQEGIVFERELLEEQEDEAETVMVARYRLSDFGKGY